MHAALGKTSCHWANGSSPEGRLPGIETGSPRLVGYARVSTDEQTTALQLDALRSAGLRGHSRRCPPQGRCDRDPGSSARSRILHRAIPSSSGNSIGSDGATASARLGRSAACAGGSAAIVDRTHRYRHHTSIPAPQRGRCSTPCLAPLRNSNATFCANAPSPVSLPRSAAVSISDAPLLSRRRRSARRERCSLAARVRTTSHAFSALAARHFTARLRCKGTGPWF
jgi:hypothetical protein